MSPNYNVYNRTALELARENVTFQSPSEKRGGVKKMIQHPTFRIEGEYRDSLFLLKVPRVTLVPPANPPASRPTNLHLASSNVSSMVVDLGGLDASLQEALEPPYVGNKHAIIQALLEVKPRLLKLFDVGTRNAEERKEVESGSPFGALIVRA